MMRILLAAGLGLALLAPVPAMAESAQGRAVSKMIAARGGAPAVPTGIDVPGPTHYYMTPSGHVRVVKDINSPRNPKFWENVDRWRGGGTGGGE